MQIQLDIKKKIMWKQQIFNAVAKSALFCINISTKEGSTAASLTQGFISLSIPEHRHGLFLKEHLNVRREHTHVVGHNC